MGKPFGKASGRTFNRTNTDLPDPYWSSPSVASSHSSKRSIRTPYEALKSRLPMAVSAPAGLISLMFLREFDQLDQDPEGILRMQKSHQGIVGPAPRFLVEAGDPLRLQAFQGGSNIAYLETEVVDPFASFFDEFCYDPSGSDILYQFHRRASCR